MAYLKKQKHGGKILVSGVGMPGVSCVTETLITGKHTTGRTHATIDFERVQRNVKGRHFIFFDLGCQTAFLDRFTGELAEFIFKEVSILIFVIDITDINSLPRVKYYLDSEIKCLESFSPTAEVFVFLNKIDLVDKKLLNEVTTYITDYLFPSDQESSSTHSPSCFPVSCASGPEIFTATDVVFTILANGYNPPISLQAFKQELWGIDTIQKKEETTDKASEPKGDKISLKIILMGDRSESFIYQYCRTFTHNPMSDMGATFGSKEIETKDRVVNLDFCHISTAHRFKPLRSIFYKGAHGFLLMFRSSASIADAKTYFQEFIVHSGKSQKVLNKKHVVLLDIAPNRCIDGQVLADQLGMTYLHLSLTDTVNMEAFLQDFAQAFFDLPA